MIPAYVDEAVKNIKEHVGNDHVPRRLQAKNK
jgi:hypothetical protein